MGLIYIDHEWMVALALGKRKLFAARHQFEEVAHDNGAQELAVGSA